MPESPPTMSLREKSAWLSLVAFIVGFAIYAWNASRVLLNQPSLEPASELLLLAVLIIVTFGLQLAIAARSLKEARTPKDEREQLIDLKATRPAFFVLMVSTIASIGTIHLPLHPWGKHLKLLMLGVMLSIALAGIVKFGTQVLLYRRDR
jgi:uncharacterized membrane protein YhaH (DUF805 family)